MIIIWYLLHVLCGALCWSAFARSCSLCRRGFVVCVSLCLCVYPPVCLSIHLSVCLSTHTPSPPPFCCFCVRVLLAGAIAHAFLFVYILICLVLFVQARFCVLSSSCMPFAHSSSLSLVNCAITKLAGDALDLPRMEYLSS